jgi:hypothetical protein
MQVLEFATHHADTGLHLGCGGNLCTQLLERGIGLRREGLTNQGSAGG